MNIDIESIGLVSLILQDSPKDRQFILCVLARSNSFPTRITFHPNTDYPTFYGYSNSRIPLYLMGKGVLSNVPRIGSAKRLLSSHYLSYAETIMNGAKSWDMSQKLESVSKFITLDNKTAYKDAEVFLVFRDKSLDYIRDYAVSHEEEISSFLGQELSKEIFKTSTSIKPVAKPAQPDWNDDFEWQRNTFVFGNIGSIEFEDQRTKRLFESLTAKKGDWLRREEYIKEFTYEYLRPTVRAINNRLTERTNNRVKIVSTKSDKTDYPKPHVSAYRILVS